jgi:hypothetical protein
MIDISLIDFPMPKPGTPGWTKEPWCGYMSTIDRMVDREFEKLIADESPTTQQEFINYMNLSPAERQEIDLQEEMERQEQEKFFAKWLLLQIKKRFPDQLEKVQAECVGLEKWSNVTERLTIRLLELMEIQKDLSGGTLWHKAFIEKYPAAVNLGGDRYLIKGKKIILQAVLAEDLKIEKIILPDPDNYLRSWICFYAYSVKMEKVAYIGWYEVKELPVETTYLIIPLSEIKK